MMSTPSQRTHHGLRHKRVARRHVLGPESQNGARRICARTDERKDTVAGRLCSGGVTSVLYITAYVPLHTHLNIFTWWPSTDLYDIFAKNNNMGTWLTSGSVFKRRAFDPCFRVHGQIHYYYYPCERRGDGVRVYDCLTKLSCLGTLKAEHTVR